MLSSNMNATETDVVQAVRKELESKPHEGLEIGYVGDFFTTGRYLHNHRHTLYLPHNAQSFQADVLHNLTTFFLFFFPNREEICTLS